MTVANIFTKTLFLIHYCPVPESQWNANAHPQNANKDIKTNAYPTQNPSLSPTSGCKRCVAPFSYKKPQRDIGG
ncbi:MAG: hypothetical protein ACK4EX_06395, partial [Thermaurantimonas sp.]|uniref:hypothetical protein n=1 Tax=Thermaurantimonas sp. TaxID=2681568 RepID=UPI00391CB233